jgi:hypothetical protein
MEWRLENAVTQREARGGSDARSARASAQAAASTSDIADATRDSVISAFILGSAEVGVAQVALKGRIQP